jgi:hypothetical protein
MTLLEDLSKDGLLAVLDIHNNSGRNPCYGCVAQMRPADLRLARLFANHAVYLPHPSSTFGVAASRWAPAVTLEAGQSGCTDGLARLRTLLRDLLGNKGETLLEKELDTAPADLRVYRSSCSFGVQPDWHLDTVDLDTLLKSRPQADRVLWLRDDIEELNFVTLTEPTIIGRCSHTYLEDLIISDEAGSRLKDPGIWTCRSLGSRELLGPSEHACPWDVSVLRSGHLVLGQGATPCMLTTSAAAIKSDCIGYVMQHIVDDRDVAP